MPETLSEHLLEVVQEIDHVPELTGQDGGHELSDAVEAVTRLLIEARERFTSHDVSALEQALRAAVPDALQQQFMIFTRVACWSV